MAEKKVAFNSKNSAPPNAISPLDKDQINPGFENLHIKLLDYPDEKRFKKSLSKMVKATIGGDPSETIPDEVGEELFKGGLQTGLEAAVVVFEVSGVSRACTHQLVRTRKAAFHQQSSRYTFMGDKFNVRMPQTVANNPEAKAKFEAAVEQSRQAYNDLVDLDIPYQDCRFIAPVGIETYIICEYPLKVFLDTFGYRGCSMFQWEIVYVFRKMREELLKVHPWLEQYIKISCEKTNKCMFQGWEDTSEQCDGGTFGGDPFEWADKRIFESEHFKPKEK